MKKRAATALAVAALALTLTGCKLVTVVPIDEGGKEAQFYYEDTEFDVEAYVKDVWPQVESYTKENAHPAAEVMAAYKEDQAACREKFGSKQPTEGAGWNYIVTDTVKVLEADTSSKAGKLRVDSQPYDGQADYVVQIGAVFKGSAIRDAMPFIAFGDFKNQMSYGDVGKQLNKYALETVITPVTPAGLAGKEITFTGVYAESDEPLVVPTLMNVEG